MIKLNLNIIVIYVRVVQIFIINYTLKNLKGIKFNMNFSEFGLENIYFFI